MKKNVFISGSETLLGRKLVERELEGGNRVIAPITSKVEEAGENTRNDLVTIPWNPSSVFSAKTVIREGERRLGKIDKVVLLNPSYMNQTAFLDMPISQIDELVDYTVRGFIYLLREIMNTLNGREDTVLSFAKLPGKSPTALHSAGCSYFEQLADSIMVEKTARIKMCGFSSESHDIEKYADFIFQYTSDLPKKANNMWLKHSDKKNLFSTLPLEKKEKHYLRQQGERNETLDKVPDIRLLQQHYALYLSPGEKI